MFENLKFLKNKFPEFWDCTHNSLLYLAKICQGLSFILDKHCGKLATLFCIDSHYTTQQEDVVWSKADFLGI